MTAVLPTYEDLWMDSRWSELIPYAEAALAKAEQSGDPNQQAEALDTLADFLAEVGRFDESCAMYRRELQLCRGFTDQSEVNRVQAAVKRTLLKSTNPGDVRGEDDEPLAVALWREKRWLDLIPYAETDLAEAEISGDAEDIVEALHNLGGLLVLLDRHDESSEVFRREVSLRQGLGDSTKTTQVLSLLASELGHSSHPKDAIPAYRVSIQAFREIQDTENLFLEVLHLSQVQEEQGNWRAAISCLRHSFNMASDIGWWERRPIILEGISRVHEKRGDLGAALDFQHRAVETLIQIENMNQAAEYMVRLGKLKAKAGHLEAAQNHIREAMWIYRKGNRSWDAWMASEELEKVEEMDPERQARRERLLGVS